MIKRILCFGEILWDLLPSGPLLGGAPLNFAFRLHGLGDQALLVSRLGNDPLGAKARVEMERLRLLLNFVQTDSVHPTGTAPVTFKNGQPLYEIVKDVAYDYIEPDVVSTRADCIYFGTLAQRSERSRATLHALLDASPEALKFLDLNLRKGCYSPDSVLESVRRADIVKLSDEEVVDVAQFTRQEVGALPSFARRLIDAYDLRGVVITRGAQGVLAASSTGEPVDLPGIPITVADTIGAGDAFAAGFAHKYLRGASLVEACRFGNALGALAASKPGGTAPIQMQEIDAILARLT